MDLTEEDSEMEGVGSPPTLDHNNDDFDDEFNGDSDSSEESEPLNYVYDLQLSNEEHDEFFSQSSEPVLRKVKSVDELSTPDSNALASYKNKSKSLDDFGAVCMKDELMQLHDQLKLLQTSLVARDNIITMLKNQNKELLDQAQLEVNVDELQLTISGLKIDLARKDKEIERLNTVEKSFKQTKQVLKDTTWTLKVKEEELNNIKSEMRENYEKRLNEIVSQLNERDLDLITVRNENSALVESEKNGLLRIEELTQQLNFLNDGRPRRKFSEPARASGLSPEAEAVKNERKTSHQVGNFHHIDFVSDGLHSSTLNDIGETQEDFDTVTDIAELKELLRKKDEEINAMDQEHKADIDILETELIKSKTHVDELYRLLEGVSTNSDMLPTTQVHLAASAPVEKYLLQRSANPPADSDSIDGLDDLNSLNDDITSVRSDGDLSEGKVTLRRQMSHTIDRYEAQIKDLQNLYDQDVFAVEKEKESLQQQLQEIRNLYENANQANHNSSFSVEQAVWNYEEKLKELKRFYEDEENRKMKNATEQILQLQTENEELMSLVEKLKSEHDQTIHSLQDEMEHAYESNVQGHVDEILDRHRASLLETREQMHMALAEIKAKHDAEYMNIMKDFKEENDTKEADLDETFSNELMKLHEDKNDIDLKMLSLKEELNTVQHEYDSLKERYNAALLEIEKNKETMKNLTDENSALQEKNQLLDDEVTVRFQDISQVHACLGELNQSVFDLQVELGVATEDEIHEKSMNLMNFEANVAESGLALHEEIKKLRANLDETKKDVESLVSERNQFVLVNSTLNGELATLKSELEKNTLSEDQPSMKRAVISESVDEVLLEAVSAEVVELALTEIEGNGGDITESLEQEDASPRNQIKKLNQKIEYLEDALAKQTESVVVDEKNRPTSAQDEKIAVLQGKLETKEKASEQLQEIFGRQLLEAQSENDELNKKQHDLMDEIKSLTQDKTHLEEQVQDVKSEITSLQDANEALLAEVDEGKETASKLTIDLQSASKSEALFGQEITNLQNEVLKWKHLMDTSKEDHESELDDWKSLLQDKDEMLKQVEVQLEKQGDDFSTREKQMRSMFENNLSDSQEEIMQSNQENLSLLKEELESNYNVRAKLLESRLADEYNEKLLEMEEKQTEQLADAEQNYKLELENERQLLNAAHKQVLETIKEAVDRTQAHTTEELMRQHEAELDAIQLACQEEKEKDIQKAADDLKTRYENKIAELQESIVASQVSDKEEMKQHLDQLKEEELEALKDTLMEEHENILESERDEHKLELEKLATSLQEKYNQNINDKILSLHSEKEQELDNLKSISEEKLQSNSQEWQEKLNREISNLELKWQEKMHQMTEEEQNKLSNLETTLAQQYNDKLSENLKNKEEEMQAKRNEGLDNLDSQWQNKIETLLEKLDSMAEKEAELMKELEAKREEYNQLVEKHKENLQEQEDRHSKLVSSLQNENEDQLKTLASEKGLEIQKLMDEKEDLLKQLETIPIPLEDTLDERLEQEVSIDLLQQQHDEEIKSLSVSYEKCLADVGEAYMQKLVHHRDKISDDVKKEVVALKDEHDTEKAKTRKMLKDYKDNLHLLQQALRDCVTNIVDVQNQQNTDKAKLFDNIQQALKEKIESFSGHQLHEFEAKVNDRFDALSTKLCSVSNALQGPDYDEASQQAFEESMEKIAEDYVVLALKSSVDELLVEELEKPYMLSPVLSPTSSKQGSFRNSLSDITVGDLEEQSLSASTPYKPAKPFQKERVNEQMYNISCEYETFIEEQKVIDLVDQETQTDKYVTTDGNCQTELSSFIESIERYTEMDEIPLLSQATQVDNVQRAENFTQIGGSVFVNQSVQHESTVFAEASTQVNDDDQVEKRLKEEVSDLNHQLSALNQDHEKASIQVDEYKRELSEQVLNHESEVGKLHERIRKLTQNIADQKVSLDEISRQRMDAMRQELMKQHEILLNEFVKEQEQEMKTLEQEHLNQLQDIGNNHAYHMKNLREEIQKTLSVDKEDPETDYSNYNDVPEASSNETEEWIAQLKELKEVLQLSALKHHEDLAQCENDTRARMEQKHIANLDELEKCLQVKHVEQLNKLAEFQKKHYADIENLKNVNEQSIQDLNTAHEEEIGSLQSKLEYMLKNEEALKEKVKEENDILAVEVGKLQNQVEELGSQLKLVQSDDYPLPAKEEVEPSQGLDKVVDLSEVSSHDSSNKSLQSQQDNQGGEEKVQKLDEEPLETQLQNKVTENEYLQDQLERLAGHLKAAVENENKLKDALNESELNLENFKERRGREEAESSNLVAMLQKELEKLTNDIDGLKVNYVSVISCLNELDESTSKLEELINGKIDNWLKSHDDGASLNDSLPELDTRITAKIQLDPAEIGENPEDFENVTKKMESMKENVNSLLAVTPQLLELVDATTNELTGNHSAYKELSEQNTACIEKLQMVEIENSHLSDQLVQADQNFKEVQSNLNSVQEKCNGLQEEQANDMERNNEISKELEIKTNQLENLEVEHVKLQELCAKSQEKCDALENNLAQITDEMNVLKEAHEDALREKKLLMDHKTLNEKKLAELKTELEHERYARHYSDVELPRQFSKTSFDVEEENEKLKEEIISLNHVIEEMAAGQVNAKDDHLRLRIHQLENQLQAFENQRPTDRHKVEEERIHENTLTDANASREEFFEVLNLEPLKAEKVDSVDRDNERFPDVEKDNDATLRETVDSFGDNKKWLYEYKPSFFKAILDLMSRVTDSIQKSSLTDELDGDDEAANLLNDVFEEPDFLDKLFDEIIADRLTETVVMEPDDLKQSYQNVMKEMKDLFVKEQEKVPFLQDKINEAEIQLKNTQEKIESLKELVQEKDDFITSSHVVQSQLEKDNAEIKDEINELKNSQNLKRENESDLNLLLDKEKELSSELKNLLSEERKKVSLGQEKMSQLEALLTNSNQMIDSLHKKISEQEDFIASVVASQDVTEKQNVELKHQVEDFAALGEQDYQFKILLDTEKELNTELKDLFSKENGRAALLQEVVTEKQTQLEVANHVIDSLKEEVAQQEDIIQKCRAKQIELNKRNSEMKERLSKLNGLLKDKSQVEDTYVADLEEKLKISENALDNLSIFQRDNPNYRKKIGKPVEEIIAMSNNDTTISEMTDEEDPKASSMRVLLKDIQKEADDVLKLVLDSPDTKYVSIDLLHRMQDSWQKEKEMLVSLLNDHNELLDIPFEELLSKDKELLAKQLKNLNNLLGGVKKDNERLTNTLDDVQLRYLQSESMCENLKAKNSDLNEKIDDLKELLEKQKKRAESYTNEKIPELEKLAERLKSRAERAQEDKVKANVERLKSDDKVLQLQDLLVTLTNATEEEKEKTNRERVQRITEQAKVETLSKQLKQREDQIEQLQTALQNEKHERSKMMSQDLGIVSDFETAFKSEVDKQEALKIKLKKEMAQKNALKDLIQNQKEQIDELIHSEAKQAEDCANLSLLLAKLRNENDQLKSALQEEKSRNQKIEKLMSESGDEMKLKISKLNRLNKQLQDDVEVMLEDTANGTSLAHPDNSDDPTSPLQQETTKHSSDGSDLSLKEENGTMYDINDLDDDGKKLINAGWTIAKVQRLYLKYFRAESFRKALVYQKRYLLILLEKLKSEKDLIIPDDIDGISVNQLLASKPNRRSRRSFRTIGYVVIALNRMKYLVRKYQRNLRKSSAKYPFKLHPTSGSSKSYGPSNGSVKSFRNGVTKRDENTSKVKYDYTDPAFVSTARPSSFKNSYPGKTYESSTSHDKALMSKAVDTPHYVKTLNGVSDVSPEANGLTMYDLNKSRRSGRTNVTSTKTDLSNRRSPIYGSRDPERYSKYLLRNGDTNPDNSLNTFGQDAPRSYPRPIHSSHVDLQDTGNITSTNDFKTNSKDDRSFGNTRGINTVRGTRDKGTEKDITHASSASLSSYIEQLESLQHRLKNR